MNIVILSASVNPFAGQAEGIKEITEHLVKNGHTVSVFMPRYKWVDKKSSQIRPILRRVRLRLGRGTKEFNIYRSQNFVKGADLYMIDKELYFARDGIIGDQTGMFADNLERFHYFSLSVLESLKVFDIRPDVVHAQDWPAAFSAIYLKSVLKDDLFFQGIPVAFTLQSGMADFLSGGRAAEEFGLSDQVKQVKGDITVQTLIEASVEQADAVGIVGSRTLDRLSLSTDQSKRIFQGALMGVHSAVWGPEKAANPYGPDTAQEGKLANKKALNTQLGLNQKRTVPWVGMVGPTTYENGSQAWIDLISQLLQKDIVVVVAGRSDLDEQLASLAKTNPEILVIPELEEPLTHTVLAATDIYLAPPLQDAWYMVRASRYGAVPVTLAGGQYGDLIDADMDIKGNTFSYRALDQDSMLKAAQRAIDEYRHPEKWSRIQKNCFNLAQEWSKITQHLMTIYSAAIDHAKPAPIDVEVAV